MINVYADNLTQYVVMHDDTHTVVKCDKDDLFLVVQMFFGYFNDDIAFALDKTVIIKTLFLGTPDLTLDFLETVFKEATNTDDSQSKNR